MASDWFYEKNGARHGPVSSAELRAMCADGRLAPGDLVWKETLPRWVKAAQLTGIRFNDDDPFVSGGSGLESAERAGAGSGAADRSGESRWGKESSPAAPPGRRGTAPHGPAPAPADLRPVPDAVAHTAGGRALFQNPLDGRRRVVAPLRAFWGTLALGPVYFLLHGDRRHALWSLALLPLSLGISHFVWPFLAARLLRAEYHRQGWRRLA